MIQYIGENLWMRPTAGAKARVDIENILHKRFKCFVNLSSTNTKTGEKSSFLDKLKFILSPDAIHAIHCLKKRSQDSYVLQYPFVNFNSIYRNLLEKFIAVNSVILIVHDVDSLRDFNGKDKSYLSHEIGLFNHCKAVILHNQHMIDVLKQYGLTTHAVSLELFDYFVDQEIPDQRRLKTNEVCFAGYLAKSAFLKVLPQEDMGVHFNLYGIEPPEEVKNNPNAVWKGAFPAEKIPYILEGSFGLVWDGTSIETCDGAIGRYVKYNNPHKFSMYIAAGLPTIVWSQSAIADIVRKYKIGIAVDSLTELKDKIEAITDEEYESMVDNTKKLQKLVTIGYFTKTALEQVERILDND